MDEETARKILGDDIRKENGLYNLHEYIDWVPMNKQITLDGSFTIEYLEAVVYWVKNKKI